MKNKVKLNAYRLSQAEFTQLMHHTVSVLETYKADDMDPKVTSLYERLAEELPQLKASLRQKNSSELSKAFAKEIEVRNRDYRTLVAGIKAHATTRNSEKAKAYDTLNHLQRQYKFSPSMNMKEAFALIDSFLNQLNQSPYREAVAQLYLSDAVVYLRESNNKANQLYMQRNQEMGARVRVDGRSIRQQMHKWYQLLYSHLVTIVTIDESLPEAVLLRLINEIRMNYAQVNRNTKSKKTAELDLHGEEAREEEKVS